MDNKEAQPTSEALNQNQPIGQAPIQPVEQPMAQMEQPMEKPMPQMAQTMEQTQPMEQPQPIDQPMPQMAQTAMNQQVMNQPVASQPVMPNDLTSHEKTNKKKRNLIIGCSVGAAVVIALVAAFLIIFLMNGEKTVSCTSSTTQMGIRTKTEVNVKVRDGALSGGDASMEVDLKNMQDSYREYEKEIVDELTERAKIDCEEGCTFDYKYTEGDNVRYTMKYDEKGINDAVLNYGIEDMSAQEIANKVQKTFEDSDATCTQH